MFIKKKLLKKYFFWEIIRKSITIACEKLNKKKFGNWEIVHPLNFKIMIINSFSNPLKYP